MWRETRISLRRFLRNPLVSLTVLLTLAVGIGAVTTAFTIVKGVLSPLDYAQPGDLLRLYETMPELKSSPNPRLAAMWDRLPVSYRDAADWRRKVRTLRGVGLFAGYTAVVQSGIPAGGEPLEVSAARMDAELLKVLGVAPALGRPFSAAEVERREHAVLLGHDLWTSAFGADPHILGHTVRLDGQASTVVGIMPPGFSLPERKDLLWTPGGPTDDDLTFRDERSYTAVARLAPGATVKEARAEMQRIAAALGQEYPDTNATTGVRLALLLDTAVGDSRRLLALFAAAAVVVLLIACINVTHVLLAQGIERRSETALRLALGARRVHLLRQSAAEALILAVCGSTGGLLLAALARRALPLFLATELPRMEKIAIDGRAALFAFGTGVAATLLSGLLPAVFASGGALRGAIAERRLAGLLQDALVVAEMALTLILTTGALALVTSWARLATAAPGFDPHGVLVQEIHLPAWRYPDETRRADFAARLLAALDALPGAQGAALSSRLPVPGPTEVWGFKIAGQDAPGGDWTQGRSAVMQLVTPGYFQLLRIPLLEGRGFTADGAEPGRVVLVSRTLAQHHWPGRSPLGATVILHEQETRVVGVFADFKQQGLAGEPGELMIQPWSQGSPAKLAVLVRVAGKPMGSAAAVRGVLRQLDPGLPLPPASRLDDLVAQSALGPRARALLLGLSAAIALLLASIGTYGVMAYRISRRRREIAIRMAAGADRAWVHRWVLRRALTLALAGAVLGVLGALAAGRLLEGLLFGVAATGVRDLGAAALFLIATCLAAAYLPARRASRLEPAVIFRSE